MNSWPDHADPKLKAALAASLARLLAQFTQRPYRPDLAQDLLAEVGASCLETLSACVGQIATRQALDSDIRALEGRQGRYWPREPDLGDGGGPASGRRAARQLLGDELRLFPAGDRSRKAVAWALLRVTLRRAVEEIGAEGTLRIVRALRDLEVLKLQQGGRAA